MIDDKKGDVMQKKVALSTFDNSWYLPGTLMRRLCWLIVSILFFENSFPWPYKMKAMLLRAFGSVIGKGVAVKPNVRIKYPWFLSISDNSWIGEGAWIDNLAAVEIKENVCISQSAYICTGSHDSRKTAFDLVTKPVVIEDGAWICAKAVLLPGSIVGSHAVISAGSVLSGTAEPYSIYRGNPAVFVKRREIAG